MRGSFWSASLRVAALLAVSIATSSGASLRAGLVYTFSAGSGDEVRLVNNDGTDGGALISPTIGSSPFGITQHKGTGALYWTDISTDSFYRADADGSNEAVAFPQFFGGETSATVLAVHVDSTGDRIYWGDSTNDVIRSANLDGSGMTTHYTGVSGSPYGVQYDVAGHRILWGDSTADIIYEFDLTTDSLNELVDLEATFGSGSYTVKGIQLSGSQMYWIDSSSDFLYSANLDGSGAQVLLDISQFYSDNGNFGGSSSSSTANGLALDGGSLYWTEGSGGKRGIYGYNLLTSTAFQWLYTQDINGSAAPIGISSYEILSPVPEPGTALITGMLLLMGGGAQWQRRRKRAAA